MTSRLNERVFKCCETVVEHFIVMDEVKKNSDIYADEHDLAVVILASCIIECIQKKIPLILYGVSVQGFAYCALSCILFEIALLDFNTMYPVWQWDLLTK